MNALIGYEWMFRDIDTIYVKINEYFPLDVYFSCLLLIKLKINSTSLSKNRWETKLKMAFLKKIMQ